ncbi:beta-N-acetylhexosaminidase [Mucilaginibacter sp. OK098]|uniref:beta-N-acetylhexosaminidase n=1 Tax=Mucilaginibacter sp. OK098 TaxID=1855297 RepID=UPI00091DCDC7|nr:beta-N-acetylhexosaminidase [Mucilaginibacter sp. OK098]SHN34514.1 hexosaminidase [Mucilaginibacter sp. OK098]
MHKLFTLLLIFTGILSANAQSTDSISLMPWPQSVKLQSGRFVFTDKFTVGLNGPVSEKLTGSINRFYQQVGKRTGLYLPQEYITVADNNTNAQLVINFKKTILPAIGVDESYTLSVSSAKITISAATDLGAMHGLETLYQLVMPGKTGYYCPVIEIADSPRFKWRGLMIDVARHFIPLEVLKRNIDAMAIVKMNVLHLHLSDDEGFRVESMVYPKLQQKGSNGLYYTQQQIKELVNYAHNRGIIIVPEFDLPGHCSGILAAYPFLASYPADYKPAKRYNLDTVKNLNIMKVMRLINEVQTPTIDPSKESTYTFFDKFIKEMSGLFPDAYLHVGADENNGVAWKQDPAITAFMKAKGFKSTDELQAYFVKRMYAIGKKYNKRLIGWEEAFNPSLPEDVIIQKWKPAPIDSLSNKIIRHNNQLIISSGYYLDLYFPAYIHYLNDPVSAGISPADADKGILGAEAAMWSEMVNDENEEIRVWPRAAAIAERLWSAATVNNVDDMYRRLSKTNFELNDRGLLESRNYINMLSRWVNGANAGAIKTLADVYTPIKGYRRLMAGMFTPVAVHPTLSSPMVNIADAVRCDSEPHLHFRKLVAAYLSKHDTACLAQIKWQLLQWQNNKVKFDELATNSPYLQTITDLSNQLTDAAAIGLQALNGGGNKDDQLKQLQKAGMPLHEVQLAILPEIEALITGKLKDEPASYPLF